MKAFDDLRDERANAIPPSRGRTEQDGTDGKPGDRSQSGRCPIDIARLLHDVAALAADMCPRSIQIENGVPSDLWFISGDPRRMQRLFLSFCIHARDAMPAGGKLSLRASNLAPGTAPDLAVPPAVREPHVFIEITDTGSGMNPENIERIALRRVSKGTTENQESLGFSMVLGVVKDHGGVLQIEAAPLRGTRYKIYLPALQRPETERRGT